MSAPETTTLPVAVTWISPLERSEMKGAPISILAGVIVSFVVPTSNARATGEAILPPVEKSMTEPSLVVTLNG